MKRSETQSEILKALANFHKNIIQPKKDANNPFFKSKYVPLENVTDVIDKVAPEYGLAYVQEALTDADKGMVGVATLLTHESGEWIEFEPLFLKADKQTAQGYGSAITYARRYSLSSAFGIASETDDDGNETTQQTQKHQQEDLKNRIQSGYDFLQKIGIDKETAEKEILKRTNKRKIETLTDQEHIDLLLEVSKAEREKIED